MASICMLPGIFIIFCSQSENGFINAKMKYSLANSQKRLLNTSCNNFISSMHFLNLPLSTAHSTCSFKFGNWIISSFSDCEMNSFNLYLESNNIIYLNFGNNLFMPCNFIFRPLWWSVTSTKIARSNSQLFSHKRVLPSSSSFFSSRKFWTVCFKMIAGNS